MTLFRYYTNATENELQEYQNVIYDKMGIQFIADIEECSVPASYIYNGALHMNDAGKEYYTNLIYEGLSSVLN